MRKSLAIGAGALVLVSALAGCGREVKPPSLAGARKALADAQLAEQQGQPQNAEKLYLAAFNGAEAAMGTLVPGDPLLPEAEKIRSESAAQVARLREDQRKQEATSGRQVAMSNPLNIKNLPPPVAPAAEAPPAEKPLEETTAPATPAETGTPQTPALTPTPTTTPAPTTTPNPAVPDAAAQPAPPVAVEPPRPPEPPKEVRITKAVLKGNKALLVYWTFSNPSADKSLHFGAPAGRATTKGGGKTLLRIRETFELKGFEFNPDDPAASRGKNCRADAFVLKPGESREMVTVGVFADEAEAGQLGAVVIEMRMSEGEDLSDKFTEVISE